MRPRAALAVLLAACASQPPPAPGPAQASPSPVPRASATPPVPADSPTPPPQPVPEASPPPPADPPVLDLLGQPRAAIEARLGKPHSEHDGWSHHADIDLQYRRGKCVRLRRTAPATLDCADVPIWAGIIKPIGSPLRRATTCEWPGLSDRHKLADGLAATHDLATHQLEIWLRD